MCARYEFSDEDDIPEINAIIQQLSRGDNTFKTGEIYPTNAAPVLAISSNKPELAVMTWGFPKWDGKGVIINAKSETAGEKKMFAKPLQCGRCVVPSTGFYEWQTIGKTKTKFRFNCYDSKALYMAGLCNGKGEFVVLTQTANEFIRDVHERMPVVMHKGEIRDWLCDAKFAGELFGRSGLKLSRIAV